MVNWITKYIKPKLKSIFKKISFSNNSRLLFMSIFILSDLFILSDPPLPGIK